MSLRELRDVCEFGLRFCEKELGVNNRHKTPLSYSIVKGNVKELGEFCSEHNRIRLFKKNIDTLDKFIKVFIHEYTHYLQPIKTKYYKMLDEYGYDKHPHEIEADENANRLSGKFIKEYRNSLK